MPKPDHRTALRTDELADTAEAWTRPPGVSLTVARDRQAGEATATVRLEGTSAIESVWLGAGMTTAQVEHALSRAVQRLRATGDAAK